MVSELFCRLVAFYAVAANSYTLDYRGFDNCGIGGWHCSSTGNEYEVIYDCSASNSMEVRLWLWTARIPSRTTVYGVSNCQQVELHFDCTMGYRSYTLKQFRATNIGSLEILAPLRPHVFLHDNDEVAHAPPDLAFYNITTVKWASGTFAKATTGRCRTKQQFIRRISFDTVNFLDLSLLGAEAFSNLTVESFRMNNVRLLTGAGSVEVAATQTIELVNNRFPKIPTNAFQLEADEVEMDSNMIGFVSSNGFSIRARSFQFVNNKIAIVEKQGFNSLARVNNFTANEWETLKSYALMGVAPGEKMTSHYTQAEQFIFQFSGNKIEEIQENSLHPNYHAYKKLCSSIIVEANSLPCSCNLPFEDPTENRSREWWQHFYGDLVLTRSNYCTKSPNCTLQQTLQVLQRQNCSNEFHPEAICTNVTANYYTPTEDDSDMTTPTTTAAALTTRQLTTSLDALTPSAAISTTFDPDTLTIALACVGAILAVAATMYAVLHIRNRLKKRALTMDANYRPQRGEVHDDDEEGLIGERFDSSVDMMG